LEHPQAKEITLQVIENSLPKTQKSNPTGAYLMNEDIHYDMNRQAPEQEEREG
jgi:hypothetical protein